MDSHETQNMLSFENKEPDFLPKMRVTKIPLNSPFSCVFMMQNRGNNPKSQLTLSSGLMVINKWNLFKKLWEY